MKRSQSTGSFGEVTGQHKAGLTTGGHYGDAGLLEGTGGTFATTGQLTRNHHSASTGSLGFRKSPFQSSGRSLLGGGGSHFMQDMIYFPRQAFMLGTYNELYAEQEWQKELAFLRDLFVATDTDGSGEISMAEFAACMRNPNSKRIFAERFGLQPHQGNAFFKILAGNDSEISLESWMDTLQTLMKNGDTVDTLLKSRRGGGHPDQKDHASPKKSKSRIGKGPSDYRQVHGEEMYHGGAGNSRFFFQLQTTKVS